MTTPDSSVGGDGVNSGDTGPAVPMESIVQKIGRLYNANTRVMLHDSPSESGPLLPKGEELQAPVDDSQYQILGHIAKGGVGVIYKARDKNLGREVALKVLRADRITTDRGLSPEEAAKIMGAQMDSEPIRYWGER